jgi:cation diffusion facilitator family transporter
MFVVGVAAGYIAQSTGMMADALDMGTDAVAYALALMAITRSTTFKRNTARWSGVVLIVLGAGIVIDVIRRAVCGSEPLGLAMMAYSVVSFAVNLYVLMLLSKYRRGEVHLRASYICTRADVIANVAVFISGGIVAITGFRYVDLLAGFAIGVYVLKEAWEILETAKGQPRMRPAG